MWEESQDQERGKGVKTGIGEMGGGGVGATRLRIKGLVA